MRLRIFLTGVTIVLLLSVSNGNGSVLTNIDESIKYHTAPEKPTPPSFNQDECLVPCDEIVDGGPDPDGIPPIENPKYLSVSDANSDLSSSDVIMGVEIDGQMYGFPHDILNWHEIVNHEINGAILSITYCPLTGTGIPYHTGASTLGTSGRLYENNLVYYDRETDSYWSQMLGLAIRGERIGDTHTQAPIIETKWTYFSEMYPDALILSRDTGFNRNYDSYPYSGLDYLRSEAIIFESTYDPDRAPYNLYHPKELTLVMNFNGSYGLAPFEELDTEIPIEINQNGSQITIFFDRFGRLAQPFFPTLSDGTQLSFTRISGDNYDISEHFGLYLYEDQLGNIWNMKGIAIDGPNSGEQLGKLVTSYTAFWFSAIAFFGDSILYLEDGTIENNEGIRTGQYLDTDSGLNLNTYYFLIGLIILPVILKTKKA